MRYRSADRLGTTKLSELVLGGAGVLMNQHGQATDADAYEVVDAALTVGVTAFDTAPLYGDASGRVSERRLGRSLSARGAEDAFLATKVGLERAGNNASERRARQDTLRSVQLSRKLTLRDTLDLVQIHELAESNFESVFAAGMQADTLFSLREEGVIRYVGVTGSDVVALTAAVRTGRFDSVQIWKRWTILDDSADSLIGLAADQGMAVFIAAPFASGILASNTPGSELHNAPPPPDASQVVQCLRTACTRRGLNLAACALSWSLDDRVTGVIVGADTASHVRGNAEMLDALPPRTVVAEIREECGIA